MFNSRQRAYSSSSITNQNNDQIKLMAKIKHWDGIFDHNCEIILKEIFKHKGFEKWLFNNKEVSCLKNIMRMRQIPLKKILDEDAELKKLQSISEMIDLKNSLSKEIAQKLMEKSHLENEIIQHRDIFILSFSEPSSNKKSSQNTESSRKKDNDDDEFQVQFMESNQIAKKTGSYNYSTPTQQNIVIVQSSEVICQGNVSSNNIYQLKSVNNFVGTTESQLPIANKELVSNVKQQVSPSAGSIIKLPQDSAFEQFPVIKLNSSTIRKIELKHKLCKSMKMQPKIQDDPEVKYQPKAFHKIYKNPFVDSQIIRKNKRT